MRSRVEGNRVFALDIVAVKAVSLRQRRMSKARINIGEKLCDHRIL